MEGSFTGMGYGWGDIDWIKDRVSTKFPVADVYMDEGVLTFAINDADIKKRFKELVLEMRNRGYVPMTFKRDGRTLIRILRYRSIEIGRSWMPALLFFVTLGTVLTDGYLRSQAYAEVLGRILGGYRFMDILINTFAFAAALMAIIGLHELGHMLSARRVGTSATPPYFIPGIPGLMPTFGAVIFQKDPPINKDDLFDSGISGPVSGFVVSIIVAIVAFMTADWFTIQQYGAIEEAIRKAGGIFLPSPLALVLVRLLFGSYEMVPLFKTLGFAAWLGMIVTAINLLPAWQLDGGRIFRPLLSRKQYMVATYASALLLVFTGYFLLGLLIILMSSRMPDIQPLDRVSPLSRGRKLAVFAAIGIFILTFVPLGFL